METQTEPAEETLQQITCYFNSYTTPEKFLPFLANWVYIDRFFPDRINRDLPDLEAIQSTGPGRLRELVVAVPQLSTLIGTAAGLQLFLETTRGLKGLDCEENILLENYDVLTYQMKIIAPKPHKKTHTYQKNFRAGKAGLCYL